MYRNGLLRSRRNMPGVGPRMFISRQPVNSGMHPALLPGELDTQLVMDILLETGMNIKGTSAPRGKIVVLERGTCR